MERKVKDIKQETQANVPWSLRGTKQSITGIVVHGNHLGRVLGFPTANVHIAKNAPEFTCLKNIVSVCEVLVDGQRFSAVGTYLPFKESYEVHLLDWEGDLYGKEITVFLLETIRENKKFDTQQQLIQHITKDVEYAKNRRLVHTVLKQSTHQPESDEAETDEVIGI